VDLYCSQKDCVEVTDKWKRVYIPIAFKTYVIYADCINKKTEILPEPIHSVQQDSIPEIMSVAVNNSMTGATKREGTPYHSETPKITLRFSLRFVFFNL
jgi:hypothetical protein